MMKNWWIKLGCFLTGYNYQIVKNSSEAVSIAVKRYTSALLIIMILWFTIGYLFSDRYLHTDIWGSMILGILMVIVILQIERQIILTIGKNTKAYWFRLFIGIIMAIIGSIIIDQIIFKEDVDKAKIATTENEVNMVFPVKTGQIDNQIQEYDVEIQKKEIERRGKVENINKNPTIIAYGSSTTSNLITDSTGKSKEISTNKIKTRTSIPNPNIALLPAIDAQIELLQKRKMALEDTKLTLREDLANELKSKTGLLDDLKILFSVLVSSPIALFVWILMFLFFLAIELFVLVSKSGDHNTDYDKIIIYQMETKKKMIDNLTEK